jgi:hypothetical protein
MTRKNCDLFTHNQSRSYLNHLVNEGDPMDFRFEAPHDKARRNGVVSKITEHYTRVA